MSTGDSTDLAACLELVVQNTLAADAAYFIDRPDPQEFRLNLRNVSEGPLTWRGTGVTPAARLQVFFSGFLSESEIRTARLSLAGWNAGAGDGGPLFGPYLALTAQADAALAPGAALEITLAGLSCALDRPQSGELRVVLRNFADTATATVAVPFALRYLVPTAATALRASPLRLRALRSAVGGPSILTAPTGVTIANELTLAITNDDPSRVLRAPDAILEPDPPRLELEAPGGIGALGSATDLAGLRLYPDEVYDPDAVFRYPADGRPVGDGALWELVPNLVENPAILGAGAAGVLQLRLTDERVAGVVSHSAPGLARLALRHRDLPGLRDAETFLYVEKRAPGRILELRVNTAGPIALTAPANFATPPRPEFSGRFRLSWKTSNVRACVLSAGPGVALHDLAGQRLDPGHELASEGQGVEIQVTLTHAECAPGEIALPLTLTALGDGEAERREFYIRAVIPRVTIQSFTKSPPTQSDEPGSSITLTWDVEGATNLRLEGVADTGPLALDAPTGSFMFRPERTLTARLVAGGPGGPAVQDLNIPIAFVSRPMSIDTFSVEPAAPSIGERITVRWNTRNARLQTITNLRDRFDNLAAMGVEAFGERTLEFREAVTMTLVCERPGERIEQQIRVPNTITARYFLAIPAMPVAGDPITLAWSVDGAVSCNISALGPVSPRGQQVVSSLPTGAQTLECSNGSDTTRFYQYVRVGPNSPQATERRNNRLAAESLIASRQTEVAGTNRLVVPYFLGRGYTDQLQYLVRYYNPHTTGTLDVSPPQSMLRVLPLKTPTNGNYSPVSGYPVALNEMQDYYKYVYGIVVRQSPEAGEIVEAGRRITLTYFAD